MKFAKYLYESSDKFFWHGTPSGDLRGGALGLHIGTYEAAKQALNARIGVPAEGDWDGKRVYGKTLIAGKRRLKELGPYLETGYNCEDVPEENYYPKQKAKRATYGDGTVVPFTCKPDIIKVRIVGPMSNTPTNPRTDDRANIHMYRDLKKNRAKKGSFYRNVGEDSGSISAVVPNASYIEKVKK